LGVTDDVDELNTNICKAIRRAAVEAIGKKINQENCGFLV